MKTIRLRSSDGEEFDVAEETICAASEIIKGMMEEDCKAELIPLPNVTGTILSLVLVYVKTHFSDPQDDCFRVPNADDPLKRFDDGFVQVDQETLFDLIVVSSPSILHQVFYSIFRSILTLMETPMMHAGRELPTHPEPAGPDVQGGG